MATPTRMIVKPSRIRAQCRAQPVGLGPVKRAIRGPAPRVGCHSFRRPTVSLVNVDFGPAMLLGSGLLVSGVALYQVRVVRPQVSRDYDIMFASVALLCGGILIFQGWRLDPLLLFGQILTAGAAITFATEAINLRGQVEEQKNSFPRARNGPLPGVPDKDDDDESFDYSDYTTQFKAGRNPYNRSQPLYEDDLNERYPYNVYENDSFDVNNNSSRDSQGDYSDMDDDRGTEVYDVYSDWD